MTVSESRHGAALALLTSLFFMWGFLTSINDILIPYFDKVFKLGVDRMHVQLVFFGAYFIGSIVYFVISAKRGDPIARIGYQRGAVLGLLISGGGALLFLPAGHTESYAFFLSALFVLGLGFTLLQISVNPYVAVLGPQRTASSRLNLCQGINSLGTVLGPVIAGVALFGFADDQKEELDLATVRNLYLIFAAALILLAMVFSRLKLPKIIDNEQIEPGLGAIQHPQLYLGAIAIFFYVGAEVSVGSILVDFLGKVRGMSEAEASPYVSVYWGGLMIGRLVGASWLGDGPRSQKIKILVGVPVIGFVFLAGIIALTKGLDFSATLRLMLPYAACIGVNLAIFLLGAGRSGRTTTFFAGLATALLAVVVLGSSYAAMWCAIGVGLCNAVMWSNIFTLAIKDLGKLTAQGSSLLVMAIVGGAVYPRLQAEAADRLGYQNSFLVPMVAYLYIAWYGAVGCKMRRKEAST